MKSLFTLFFLLFFLPLAAETCTSCYWWQNNPYCAPQGHWSTEDTDCRISQWEGQPACIETFNADCAELYDEALEAIQ